MNKWKDNIANLDIPKYKKEQDDFNFYSHLIGVPVGLAIFIAGIVIYIRGLINVSSLIGLLIFGLGATLLYAMSASYHKTAVDNNKKKIKRAIDHSTIYVLIASTYTPICIYLMNNEYFVMGLTLLIVQWVCAIIGAFINMYNLKNKAVKIISMALYILMGWMILYTTGFRFIPTKSFYLILIGGITYTLGSILYGIGHKKNLWFHCIFHVFVLFGTILQAIGVFFLFF